MFNQQLLKSCTLYMARACMAHDL